jgi:hypothetical protein
LATPAESPKPQIVIEPALVTARRRSIGSRPSAGCRATGPFRRTPAAPPMTWRAPSADGRAGARPAAESKAHSRDTAYEPT